MSLLRRSPRRSDRGVSLILFSLLAVAMLVISALVVDLSFVRQNRQAGKSSADFAATAGIRSLDNGSGGISTWQGICAARDYLFANDPAFVGMSESYANGVGTTLAAPCGPPPSGTLCVDSEKSTWGVLTGQVDGGRLRVTIRNGYEIPDPLFPEDTAGTYAGDVADPCLHVAVIVEEREGAYFGGVAGASGYDTRVRSVARAQRGGGGEIAPAMILLERTKCQVLTSSGTGATVEARGQGNAAGTIHSDSLASDSSCANNRKVFDVDGSPSAPAIRAMRSADGSQAGSITSVSLSGATGAQSQFTADSPQETCVQASATDCVVSPITGAALTGRSLVTRSVVDSRYLTHVRTVRDLAATRFAWSTDTQASNGGFTPFGCNATSFTTATAKVFVNCNGNGWNGSGKTFPDGYEVVINGYVNTGSQPVNFGNNTKVYVRGESGSNRQAIFTNGDTILHNVGTSTSCDARYTADPSARALLVVGNGYLGGNGGVIRLCQTTVVMLDSSGSTPCPIPTSTGLAPYDNSCRGEIDIGGNAVVDWSAPNVNDVSAPTPAQLANFEDLALWSETQQRQGIAGNGGLDLAGIFFTPNADPFTLNGGGVVDLTKSQFVSRRLRATGGGTLTLSPKEPNAVTLPALEGFTLVR